MKKIAILIIYIILTLPLLAQLNVKHNGLRAGDIIIKQQVEYKAPLSPGTNLVWDFSKLDMINKEYELVYSAPLLTTNDVFIVGSNTYDKKKLNDDELIIGTEHNTMYYFKQSPDSLLLLGHENPVINQKYIQPLQMMKYPLNYGERYTHDYNSEGLYSNSIPIATKGCITIHADAYGKILLPTGDTIGPVLRVKTEQKIIDITKYSTEEDKGKVLESYKWYTKAYRYPIFEVVRNIDLNTDSVLFSTAFYYPLQAHLYLNTDPDNLALLDDLWNLNEENKDSAKTDTTDSNDERLKPKIYVYPNPVIDLLHINYELKEADNVTIRLCSLNGFVEKTINKGFQPSGEHQQQIDCTGLMQGVYIVEIVAGKKTVNQKIVKK